MPSRLLQQGQFRVQGSGFRDAITPKGETERERERECVYIYIYIYSIKAVVYRDVWLYSSSGPLSKPVP